MSGRLSSLSFGLATVLLLVGCTQIGTVEGHLEHVPQYIQIPLKVGIAYPPDLPGRTAKVEIEEAIQFYTFNIGESTTTMFNQIAARMFSETPRIPGSIAPSAEFTGVDGVLFLDIIDFDVQSTIGWDQAKAAQVDYFVSLKDSDGSAIADWSLRGHAKKSHRPTFAQIDLASDTVKLAILDALTEFMSVFEKHPAVREWLAQNGVSLSSREKTTESQTYPGKIRLPNG